MHAITDFFSFYTLFSTVMAHLRHLLLLCDRHRLSRERGRPRASEASIDGTRGEVIILANQAKFEVLNALMLMDNPLFLQDSR